MTYLVDAPLLVEMLQPEPAPQVKEWVQRHDHLGLSISALALAELQAGLARTSAVRRNLLTRWMLLVEGYFASTAILPFDMPAARMCSRLLAAGDRAGAAPPLHEAMTAAIAEANDLILAARPTPGLALWGGRMVDP